MGHKIIFNRNHRRPAGHNMHHRCCRRNSQNSVLFIFSIVRCLLIFRTACSTAVVSSLSSSTLRGSREWLLLSHGIDVSMQGDFNMKKHLMMLALVSAPLSVFAADMNNGGFGPAKGDREFTLSGAGTSNKDFDRGSLGLAASFGWYLTDIMEVSIRQGVNYADLANNNM